MPRHDVLVQDDVEGRMRDGVVLRANVYRPADERRYPVLLSRQPYNKDVNINLAYADPVELAAHGYVVVMQDVRHSSYLGNVGQLDFGPAASGPVLNGRGGLNGEHLRWYDATLKGDETALADVPPVRLFVMGENRWRSFDRWPVPATRVEDWHLQPGGGLARSPASESDPDVYDYDPADPVPTLGGSTMLAPTLPPGPFDQRDVEARPDVLSYTSAPLTEPYTVLGAVSVTLFAASSARDTDFVARLVDVHPDGRAFNVVDRIIRAAARDTYPAPGVVEPRPSAPLTPDAPLRFCIDLWATGLTFRPGHRIRVDVTSSSHPRWIRHTNTTVDPVDATELRVARQRVFHDPARPSRIGAERRPCPTSSTRRWPSWRKSSGDLVGVVHDGVGPAERGADGEGPVQPGEVGRRGLEGHRHPEVVQARVDELAVGDPGQHLRRPVPEAAGAQVGQCPVGKAEQVARVDDGRPVVGHHLPVGAVVEDLAREARPLEPATGDRDDPSGAQPGGPPEVPGRARQLDGEAG
ncbi:MAG: CocE/NonD family hydrolase [Pseudonocardia sp.]|nr:CocE/NonD family hydrolase [Pseudonocardia sp.]